MSKLETNNVIIDLNINRQTFFYGAFSATFNIPKTGKYLIKNPFSVACHKVANTSQQLYVKIDNNNVLNYMYFATSKDNEWGDTRRTLQGNESLVELTEGEHTITTSGRIDFDQYSNFNNTPVQLFALRLA